MHVFLVPSVITPNRSQAFTPEERYAQLLYNVEQLRKRVEGCFIVLIESSNVSDSVKATLIELFDHCIWADGIQHYIDDANIGCGEHKQMEIGIEYLLANAIQAELVFKISARYFLNEAFNINVWDVDKYNFKPVQHDNCVVYCTGLYAIPFHLLREFKNLLELSQMFLSKGAMVEKTLYLLINRARVHDINTLGLTKMLSYNRKVIHE